MKPDHKSLIVKNLQLANFKVAMVGDGANDCSALKQADIGVSFSVAEASFCAPFSSLDISISCVEKVLLEGRGTLLNYIEVFRYTMSTAFLKYFAVMMLSFSISFIKDFQFFFGTFIGVLPATFFLGTSPPVDKLSARKPPQSIMGLQNILSIYGHNLISAIALITVYVSLKAQNFYKFVPELVDGNLRTTGTENTSIVLVIHVLFMISNFSFVFTTPFKKRYYYNIPLTAFVVLNLIYNTAVIFDRSLQLSGLGYIELSADYNLNLFLISYGFGMLMIIYEEVSKNFFLKFHKNNKMEGNNYKERVELVEDIN